VEEAQVVESLQQKKEAEENLEKKWEEVKQEIKEERLFEHCGGGPSIVS
jgi:uncharacterized protein YifE (UPF0438 family)